MNSSSRAILPWNEYFRLRQQRNRMRPVVGIPFFLGGYTAFAQFYEFSPFEPILGVDPFIVVSACALLAGTATYQIGAGLGQFSWRLLHRKLPMDRMDKIFFSKIQHYRAERGNSPYVRQMSNARNLLQFDQRSKNRQDFYGESIKSISDYRNWLRKERKLTREHLGPDIKPIRGVPQY
jgi:import inner membrane translocase subunit TIM23